MPTYDYVCDQCGERREVRHAILASPPLLCSASHPMRRDVGAAFPHVSLQWHKDQGIGARLVLQSTGRRSHGPSGIAADPC